MVEYFEIIIKSIYFFILILLVLRVLGKREVGEISVFDLVVLLIIADIATLGINDGWVELLLSTISMLTLLGLQKLFAFLTLRFPKFRNVVDYKPSIIIYDGKLNLKEMKKQSYTMDDLITQSRNMGVMDLNEIKLAILESTGQLSIYKKNDYKSHILPVVVSGRLIEENLNILQLNTSDVISYLKTLKLDLKHINYMSSDGYNYYFMRSL